MSILDWLTCPYCGIRMKEEDVDVLYHPCDGKLAASLFDMPVEVRETIPEDEIHILNRYENGVRCDGRDCD